MMRIGRGTVVLLLVLAASGCATRHGAGSSPTAAASPTLSAPSPRTRESQAPTRTELPPGFPVMSGAEPAKLPADVTIVARWTVPVVGSAAYDFYSGALPDAGYAIVGSYPSERAALIRFRDPAGQIWQLVAELIGDGTRITIQTDRP